MAGVDCTFSSTPVQSKRSWVLIVFSSTRTSSEAQSQSSKSPKAIGPRSPQTRAINPVVLQYPYGGRTGVLTQNAETLNEEPDLRALNPVQEEEGEEEKGAEVPTAELHGKVCTVRRGGASFLIPYKPRQDLLMYQNSNPPHKIRRKPIRGARSNTLCTLSINSRFEWLGECFE